MCPPAKVPDESSNPAARRPRANLANWRTMRWLDDERKRQGLSLRDVGKLIGYHNATRVGQYLDQKIVAGPDMVRRLAIAVNVPPIEALWKAAHYSFVFDYLEKLYGLGYSWLRDDKVYWDPSGGARFFQQNAPLAGEPPSDQDLADVPMQLSHRYHQAEVHNLAGVYKTISLPLPMAYAILLGVGLFPRRGDRVRDQTSAFTRKLSRVASEMLGPAERARVPAEVTEALRKPLKEAERILPWRFYPAPTRLAVVAEYVQAWCSFACRDYADYARVALYSAGGFVGAPSELDDIWQWQHADLPTLHRMNSN